ncbi:MAG: sulfate reduction electron transfer complex DsrMKJOP subunit DsrJ [Syntrophobacteraceae bacterium]
MKIYDGKYILIGLLAFVVLATFPIWYDHGKAVPPANPSLNTPVIDAMAHKHCILSKEQMITGHMLLLNQWRTEVVRYGKRVYVAPGGEKYQMSLETECFRCHSNKAEFCDRCHNYAGLEKASDPYCFTCHVVPAETKPGAGAVAMGQKENK